MASELGLERAREWLRRNRLGHIEPSALLVDRLEARRRGNRIYGFAFVAFFALVFAGMLISDWKGSGFDPDESEVARLGSLVLNNVCLLLAMGVGQWYAYRTERRLIMARRTRTAHPTAAGMARVLGTRYLAAVLVVYGGGLLLGAATALMAHRPADRTLALTFLGSVTVLAVVSGLALTGVLRRPSVAEDSDSLLVDDVLRTQDARAAVMPFPIVVAVIAAAGSSVGSWLIWSFLGYAALGSACWAAVAIACRLAHRPVRVAQ
jgi:hypothetical protein